MNPPHLSVIGKSDKERIQNSIEKKSFFSWLDTKEDDGKIVRELTLGSAAQHLDKTTYNIRIKTGDRLGAGTDANVHLKIFGEKGDTDKIRLVSSDNTSNKFEKGRIDKFTYEFDDFGEVCLI